MVASVDLKILSRSSSLVFGAGRPVERPVFGMVCMLEYEVLKQSYGFLWAVHITVQGQACIRGGLRVELGRQRPLCFASSDERC